MMLTKNPEIRSAKLTAPQIRAAALAVDADHLESCLEFLDLHFVVNVKRHIGTRLKNLFHNTPF